MPPSVRPRRTRGVAPLLAPFLALATILAVATDGRADFNFTDVTTPVLADTVVTYDKKGVAFIDYDRDGDPDLCIAGEGPRAVSLLRNDAGVFTDVTSGDLNYLGSGSSVTWGDFDGDGDPDLLLVLEEQPQALFRNDGGDTFTDVTSGDMLLTAHGHSSSWVDIDRDGQLEAYQANLKQPSQLYRWNGTVWDDIATDSLAVLLGDGVAWGDYDDDGDQDVYLARFSYGASLMLRNDSPAGFANVTFGGLAFAANAHSCAWADYDNDGRLDLFIAVANASNRLLHNLGGGVFTVTTPANMTLGGHSVGPCWGDYDNDGDQDLFLAVSDNQPCHMFRNDGNGVFTDVTAGPLVGTGGNAGVVHGDYDRDGDLDLYLGSYFHRPNLLLRNDLANGHHWLQLSLTGTRSNTTALGARVEIKAGGVRQIRELTGCTGFRGHSDYVVHFGLGGASVIDSLRIRWPSGLIWDTTAVTVDQRLNLTEHDTPSSVPPHADGSWSLAVAPNPVASRARLTATLQTAAIVTLDILDPQGRHVATLSVGEPIGPGVRTWEWSLERDRGGRVRPGVYLVRMAVGSAISWRKLVVAAS